jgi:hypothetical protein
LDSLVQLVSLGGPLMYNFPASPTVGQTTQTPNGVFAWDGIKWAPSPSFSLAGTANPLMDGAAAPGVSGLYSRQDHVHPSDTSRALLAGSSTQAFAVANGTGSNAINASQMQSQFCYGFNQSGSTTSLSATTNAMVAPCIGFAIVFVDFTAGVNSGGFSMSASLGGFVQLVGSTFGINGYGFGYLPMQTGQSSTFTATSAPGSATNCMIAIRAFFVPATNG